MDRLTHVWLQVKTSCRSLKLRRWTPQTSSQLSKLFSLVSAPLLYHCVVLTLLADIYRIMSSKSLEQSADAIKAPTSDTIPVAIDSSAPAKAGSCC